MLYSIRNSSLTTPDANILIPKYLHVHIHFKELHLVCESLCWIITQQNNAHSPENGL